jgi:hypothetical protein
MEIKENLKNEEIKLAEEKLVDLPVVEEQADETKGAGTATGKLYVATNVGVLCQRIEGSTFNSLCLINAF